MGRKDIPAGNSTREKKERQAREMIGHEVDWPVYERDIHCSK